MSTRTPQGLLPVCTPSGTVRKHLVEEPWHGEIPLYSLKTEKGKRDAYLYALVRGILFSVCLKRERESATKALPVLIHEFKAMLRENVRARVETCFRAEWEAVGLPIAEFEKERCLLG